MAPQENKIETIKKHWSQVGNNGAKTKLIKAIATDLGKSPLSLKTHWFASFWRIPLEYQPRVLELIQHQIAMQNQAIPANTAE
jgi:hypothetical protein